MKTRTDFVTNSSSSSFILSFDSADTVEEELKKEKILDPYRISYLVDQIIEGQTTVDSVVEKVQYYQYYRIRWAVEENIAQKCGRDYLKTQEWIKNNMEEFEKMVKDALNADTDQLRSDLKDKNFISIIEVSDHTDSELEHEIMPYLGCTVKRISHH